MCVHSELSLVPTNTCESMALDGSEEMTSGTTSAGRFEELNTDYRNFLDAYSEADSPEPLPLLAEYFGVAIAICALVLVSKCDRETRGSPISLGLTPGLQIQSIQRQTLRRLWKGAMERLGVLAWKAVAIEEKMKQQTVAHSEVVEKTQVLSAERFQCLKKIGEACSEVEELRKRRAEDAKANEKVVSIFATREQGWKIERRKFKNEQQRLWHELQRALKEQEAFRQKIQQTRTLQGEKGCEVCGEKEALVVELKDRLGEQEFLIMATMEEAKAEQQERNELAGKLAVADVIVADLREKLANEGEERAQDFRKHQAIVAEFKSKQRHMEKEMSHILEELRSYKREKGMLMEEKNCSAELVGRMSVELTKLQKDTREKEEIISAMLRKASADAEEKHELGRQLAIVKAKLMHAESEKEKWKRLVEEKSRSCSKREMFRPRSSFGSRTDSGLDMVGEMQRLHDIEIRNLQSIFEEQVKALQNRVRLYQERVADLEENILLHMADSKRILSLPKPDGNYELKSAEHVESREIVSLKESMEADIAAKQFQLSVAKNLLTQYMDSDIHREQEVDKWKKLYFASKATVEMLQKEKEHAVSTMRNPRLQDRLEVEKARYASKLEQRHWQEIDAFERQMRAKDERMEAFRWQLLTMESDAKKRLDEIEALNKSLSTAREEKLKLERDLREKEQELGTYRDQFSLNDEDCSSWMLVTTDQGFKGKKYEREVEILHEEIFALKNLLRDKELEHESTTMRVAEEAESELQEKDFKLAVVEAQLVQAHIYYEKEKKAKEKISRELLKEKAALECFLKNHLSGKTELGVKDAIHAACLEMERLSMKIIEAQLQMSQIEKQHGEQLKELVEQAVNDSKCGFRLKSFKGFLSNVEESGDRKVALMEQCEPLRWPTEGHDVEDEPTVDKYVSIVEPDWLLSGASPCSSSNLPEVCEVETENTSTKFQTVLISPEGCDTIKFVRLGRLPQLNAELDLKNVLQGLSGDPGPVNDLHEVTEAFGKLNLQTLQLSSSQLQLVPWRTGLQQQSSSSVHLLDGLSSDAHIFLENTSRSKYSRQRSNVEALEVKTMKQILVQQERKIKLELVI